MISVHFQGKPFNITVIKDYALTSNAEEAEVGQLYEDLQDLFRTNIQKRCPFHYRGLECKSRKSRKIPEKQLNEVEIGNLLEKEFKIMIMKMIQDLWKTMEKMQKMFTKGLQELKNKQR